MLVSAGSRNPTAMDGDQSGTIGELGVVGKSKTLDRGDLLGTIDEL